MDDYVIVEMSSLCHSLQDRIQMTAKNMTKMKKPDK